MSRFFSEQFLDLEPYVPGEQPRDQKYVKLNTNENPYPPAPEVEKAVTEASRKLCLYSDPECAELRKALAKRLAVSPDELIMTNGSDEILYFAFLTFCDKHSPAYFADITYGFYPVYAAVNRIPYETIPLKDDLTIDITDYYQRAGTIFIANPNAPTAIALRAREIEEILKRNPYNVVVVDEAYVDFGAESCVPLIREYDNLLVTQTFSKSRSMAGARLGMGIGNPELIRDLNTLRFSVNPYNINSMTAAAGIASLKNDGYNRQSSLKIMDTRERYGRKLRELGFEMTESQTNFFFARHPEIPGEELYRALKKRGVLVRHFTADRIKDYNRISIGTPEQMDRLIEEIKGILEDRQ